VSYIEKFRRRLNLRQRIFIFLSLIIILTLAGGSFTFIYALRVEALFIELSEIHLSSIKTANQIETALANIKGYVSYYFIEKDPKWLGKMNAQRDIFLEKLRQAKNNATLEEDREALQRIEKEYLGYMNLKDRVIELYKTGQSEKGIRLHQRVREKFFDVMELTDQYREIHDRRIRESQEESRHQAKSMMLISSAGTSVAFFLAVILAFVLFRQILEPIERLSLETAGSGVVPPGDEVTRLRSGVHNLLENMDRTRSELEKSRDRLVLSERMAVVGKLAAEVAHSIRNPMTSIKMRLFSLEKKLQDITEEENEDLEVVREELRRLDNIVQNFLEFSRPPRLKKQPINVSEVVDNSLQLLQYRLEKQKVKVIRRRAEELPPVEADSELLKEVIVNIIVNALEVMPDGGKLIVTEEDSVAEHIGWAVVIKITDTGPGIAPDIKDKIVEPFFSTKENGTGLGLSIADRIVLEHGGQMSFSSIKGGGATFYITLPVKENSA